VTPSTNHHNRSPLSSHRNSVPGIITEEMLAAALAHRVLGWRTAPNRYITSGRSWIPRWRFRPFTELADALKLLDCAADHYTLKRDGRVFSVEIQASSGSGIASGELKARPITLAVARAVGLLVDQ